MSHQGAWPYQCLGHCLINFGGMATGTLGDKSRFTPLVGNMMVVSLRIWKGSLILIHVGKGWPAGLYCILCVLKSKCKSEWPGSGQHDQGMGLQSGWIARTRLFSIPVPANPQNPPSHPLPAPFCHPIGPGHCWSCTHIHIKLSIWISTILVLKNTQIKK